MRRTPQNEFMKIKPCFPLNVSLLLLTGIILALASSCSPAPTPTPFIPPTSQSPLIEPTLIINPTPQVVQVQSIPLPTLVPTINPETCVNDLTFIDDVTIPDNTNITYGSTIDKQWLVQNSGTCNWNSDYHLMRISGAALGSPQESIPLYPARANAQATLQITFTAPFTDGTYESAWQAFDPKGFPFGDPIYVRVVVVPP